jgi:RHS repeat-associated protein
VHLYKAWGETRYSSGTIPTTYLYTGQRRESSLGGPEGLYFYGARWLDPYLNRWIQPDTIVPQSTQGVQAWDRFAYANNNPLRYTDPTGHTISCGAGETGACGGETPESRYWELRHYYLNCQNRTGQNCPNGLGIIAFTGVSLVVAGAAGPTVDSVAGATDVISQELISACVSNPICARIILGIYVYNEMESIPEQDRHHLLPQYIAKILGIDPGEGPAIYLEKPDHYLYTQLWRQLFGYKGSSNYDLTLNITKEQLIQAVETVYKGFPEYIEAIKQFLERLP